MKELPPLPPRYLVDFDGTLCNTSWGETGWVMGEPMRDVIDAVNNAHNAGNEIVIFTSRPRREWEAVRSFLTENGVLFDKVRHKPLAKGYIDDRGLRPNEFVELWKKTEGE